MASRGGESWWRARNGVTCHECVSTGFVIFFGTRFCHRPSVVSLLVMVVFGEREPHGEREPGQREPTGRGSPRGVGARIVVVSLSSRDGVVASRFCLLRLR